MSFIPTLQRTIHRELDPGDFVRIQSEFYIIDEVRRFRFPFVFAATGALAAAAAAALTGSLKSRFRHIDKFSMAAAVVTSTVQLLFRQTDVTGLQFANLFTTVNANMGSPVELDINSFSREDLINANVIFGAVETGVTLWFSGEEYTLVKFPEKGGIPDPKDPEKGLGIPERFVIVTPYGFSKVNRYEVFRDAQIAFRLRT